VTDDLDRLFVSAPRGSAPAPVEPIPQTLLIIGVRLTCQVRANHIPTPGKEHATDHRFGPTAAADRLVHGRHYGKRGGVVNEGKTECCRHEGVEGLKYRGVCSRGVEPDFCEGMKEELQPPDSHHLRAAEGWIGLGNWREASEELEAISPAQWAHPDVLEVRWHICAQAKKWDACLDVAEATIKLEPNDPGAWIHRSFALRRLKGLQEALDQLVSAADRFPKVWVIPYNLACYCAQLGRLDESRAWLKRAISINEPIVKRVALDDPDLEPLWNEIGNPGPWPGGSG
jgi:hypothetical protein